MAKQTTRELVQALEAEGFENSGDGVWSVDLDCHGTPFTLYLSPTDIGNEYVVWWQEWLHAGQEGDDEGRGTFSEMASLAMTIKRLADMDCWEELGFEYCGDVFDENDLREDIKADTMREPEEPSEQMVLI